MVRFLPLPDSWKSNLGVARQTWLWRHRSACMVDGGPQPAFVCSLRLRCNTLYIGTELLSSFTASPMESLVALGTCAAVCDHASDLSKRMSSPVRLSRCCTMCGQSKHGRSKKKLSTTTGRTFNSISPPGSGLRADCRLPTVSFMFDTSSVLGLAQSHEYVKTCFADASPEFIYSGPWTSQYCRQEKMPHIRKGWLKSANRCFEKVG